MTVVCDTLCYVMFFITTVVQAIVSYLNAFFLNVAAVTGHITPLCPKRPIDKVDELIPFSCRQ